MKFVEVELILTAIIFNEPYITYSATVFNHICFMQQLIINNKLAILTSEEIKSFQTIW